MRYGAPMKPRELVASAAIPGHAGSLQCWRHDGAFAVWVGRTELMSSRVHESEELLADVVLQSLGARPAPRVLVGGLGMGFTLARTLAGVDAQARVEVVELVPEIVAWNRYLYGHCAGHPLADPRVHVTVGDVGAALADAAAAGAYDAILLDVDNGPEALVHPDNARLYAPPGLLAARAALRPGGVLGVWSSAEAPTFAGRLQGCGFTVATHRTRARGHKGPRRTVWTAVRR
jgi:spermidine synthase